MLVGMSGGVDSSVAALLLQQQGVSVQGAYMKNWINEEGVLGDCPWQQDIEDARAVAESLEIPFRVVNLMDAYRSKVVAYLLQGYESGVTPNPDVMCNREIKFGVFLEYARAQGFNAVATGHYARRRQRTDGTWDILEGLDKSKDQSYFLALLRQDTLVTAAKKDSQGICFIGNVRMTDFLRAFVPDKPGPIKNLTGALLGAHRGLHLYTLGQRRGIGVPSNTPSEAYVVVEKRMAANELIVAFDRPESRGLYATRCRIGSISFTNEKVRSFATIEAKPRYRARAARLRFEAVAEDAAVLEFTEPQRALTPGQICALYDGEMLLGGGVFEEILD
jgi:tRNA-specific 2-thiouridylase